MNRQQILTAFKKTGMWPLNKLVPYARNPRRNDAAVSQMVASIREYGFKIPVLCRSNGEVVDGHLRIKAAQELGMEQLPVILCDEWSPAQVKAFRLMVNRSVSWAEWDAELLGLEMVDLQALNYDLSLTGFETAEVKQFLQQAGQAPPGCDEDATPAVQPEPVTVSGDLWLLGEHRVLCGDSTSVTALQRLCGGKGDMLLTDPPYGMRLDADWSGCVGSIGSIGQKRATQGNKYAPVIGDAEDYDPGFLIQFFKGVKEQFWFGADYYAERIPGKNDGSWLAWDKRKDSQADAIGSEFELIWSKAKHKRRMLRHDWFGFLSSENSKEAQKRVHPTQKPTSLIIDVLQQWGAGCSVIVDPYLGSGSTLIACEKTERHCLGMEMSTDYVDVIVRRWQTFTGKQATLESDGRTFDDLSKSRLKGRKKK